MKKKVTKKAARRPFDWRAKFQSQITSAEDAADRIKPGQRVFVGTG